MTRAERCAMAELRKTGAVAVPLNPYERGLLRRRFGVLADERLGDALREFVFDHMEREASGGDDDC